MRPPPESGGYNAWLLPSWIAWSGFNEAAARKRRIHGDTATPDDGSAGFNEAAARKRRIRCGGALRGVGRVSLQ